MKKLLSVIGIMVLMAVLSIALPACENCGEKDAQEAAQPGSDLKQPGSDAKQPGSAAKQPGSDTKQPGSAAKGPGMPGAEMADDKTPTPEEYWNIMLERLKVTKQNYEETLAVYQKYEDEPDKAREEIQAVRKKSMQAMQKIFTDYGMTMGRHFYPRGPDAAKIKQEREQYRREHPEIQEQYTALRTEIQEIRKQLTEYTGRGPTMGSGPRRGPDRRGFRGPGGTKQPAGSETKTDPGSETKTAE